MLDQNPVDTRLSKGNQNDFAKPDAAAENFAEMVKESKETLQFGKITDPKIKRRPGRPPGTGKNQVAAREASGLSLVQPTQQPSVSETAPAVPLDISGYLAQPLIAISKFPAAKYEIPELALSPEEADMCAKSLNEMLKAFVPDTAKMSPKTAAVLGAAVTFGSIGFQKYAIYSAKKPAAKATEVQTDIAGGPKIPNEEFIPRTTATSYFESKVV